MATKKKVAKKPVAKKSIALKKKKKNVKKGKYILVTLPGSISAVVQASTKEDAWEQYKKVAGILDSDHEPKYSVPSPEVCTDDHGIVVDSNGGKVWTATTYDADDIDIE